MIYCHGLDSIVSDNIKTVVKLMNGTYQSSFTKDVTHIITENSFSSNDFEPYDLEKKFIVNPSWIYDIWQKAEYIPEKDYTLKCFSGLKICASGMTKEMKSILKDLVIENGGEFSLILDKSCTHLLIEEPLGRKYKYAKRWNIITLDPAWVYQSIASGFAYPVQEFLVNNQNLSLSINDEFEVSGITSIDCTYPDNNILNEVKKQFETNTIKDLDATTCEVDSNNSIDVFKSDEDSKIFSGCRLYFCDLLNSSLPVKAQKKGAIIETSTEHATHIIVKRSKLTPEEENVVKTVSKDVLIIKKSWISDSLLMNRLMKIDEYIVHRHKKSDTTNLSLLPHALLKAKNIYNANKSNQHSSLVSTAHRISQTKLMSHRSLLTAMSQRKKMKKRQNLIEEFVCPLSEEQKLESTDVHVNDEIVSSGVPDKSSKKRSSPIKDMKPKKKLSLSIFDIGEKEINKRTKKAEDKVKKQSSTTPIKKKESKVIDDSQKDIILSQLKENELIIPDSYIPSNESLTPPKEKPLSYDGDNYKEIDIHQEIDDSKSKQSLENKTISHQDIKNLTTISHIYPSYGSCLGGELVFVYCNNDPQNVRVAFDDIPARTGRENQTDTVCLWALTPSKEKASIVKVSLIDSNGKCVSHNDPPILFSYKAV